MIGWLRFAGIANAALWFGCVFFFTVAVGPSFFSAEMLAVFGGPKSDAAARYYAGGAAQVVFERYSLV